MCENNQLIEQFSSDINIIKLSKEVYFIEAVTSASNKFNDFFFIKIDICENNDFKVIFETKDKTQSNDLIQVKLKDFCNELLEQQVRENLNKQFGNLRESIYQKAFSSVQD